MSNYWLRKERARRELLQCEVVLHRPANSSTDKELWFMPKPFAVKLEWEFPHAEYITHVVMRHPTHGIVFNQVTIVNAAKGDKMIVDFSGTFISTANMTIGELFA